MRNVTSTRLGTRRLLILAGYSFAVVIASAAGLQAQDHDHVAGQFVGDDVVPASYVGDLAHCDAAVGHEGGHCTGCSGGACADGACAGGACVGGACLGGLGLGGGSGDGAAGMLVPRAYGQPDLFYNFYTQGYVNQANAQMYLSPLPIPPNVGHTYFTYQPFYPHHMMYWHKDRFHRYYDQGRGMNRTRAVYYSPPVRQFASNLYWNCLRIPR